MNDFQENLLDHYTHPRNFGDPNFTPTYSAKVQNLSCGDEIEIFLKVEKGRVVDIKFKGEGCSIAIGSTSIFIEDIIGKKVEEILAIQDNYTEELIGIPLTISRKRCATLPIETLKEALKSYKV